MLRLLCDIRTHIVYSKSSVTMALCKSDEGFEEIQGGGGGCLITEVMTKG